MKPQERAESVFETLNQVPNEFWFVWAHAQKNELGSLGSMMNQHFDTADQYVGDNAASLLLRRANR